MADFHLNAPIRLFAPAKVNLSLEVCGRRPDNYHDIVTLMETVSLFDLIDFRPADTLTVYSEGAIPVKDDLTWRALEQIREWSGDDLCLHVTVTKRIPISAGLGGGSSDAGTLIRSIGQLVNMPADVMHDIAASLGSDVPFFLRGGMAVASGTGIELESIEPCERRWYVIVMPRLKIDRKTAKLYQSLTESEYSDGSRTRALAAQIAQIREFDASLPVNAFQRALLAYPAFEQAVAALEKAGGTPALASGAGPSVFAMCDSFESADRLHRRLIFPAGQTFIATSMGPNINQLRATGFTK